MDFGGCWWFSDDFYWVYVVRKVKNTKKCCVCLQKLHLFDKKQCSSKQLSSQQVKTAAGKQFLVDFGGF